MPNDVNGNALKVEDVVLVRAKVIGFHDGRVALDIYDQANPYRQAAIRGKIVEMTTDGADAHIDRLAKKYLGQDTYPFRQPGERRVVLKIAPTRIVSQGLES